MGNINSNLLNIDQASKYLKVSKTTVRRWEKEGRLRSLRTPGKHRRFTIYELNKIVSEPESINTNFIGKFNTYSYSELEINNLIEFIQRNAKSGIC